MLNKKNKNYITGIIDSKGSGGVSLFDEKFCSFQFKFKCWYKEGGIVCDKGLLVVKNIYEDELKNLMSKTKGETIIRISYGGETSLGRITLEEILDFDMEDKLLEAYVLNEIIYVDADLGLFNLDKLMGDYRMDIEWCGSEAELSFETDDEAELIELLDFYKEKFSDNLYWDKLTKQYAAKKLLALKNDYWLEDDEEELDEDEFVSLISLESLVIDYDKSYTFWYRDGDIFGGHVIIVSGNIENGHQSAEIAG